METNSLAIILGLVEAGWGWSADTSRLQACRRGLSRWRLLCRRPSQPRVLPRAKDRDYPWLRDNADGKARIQDDLYDLDTWWWGINDK